MAGDTGRPMVLPTDRHERQGRVGPWVRQLNIDELRDEVAETIAAIRVRAVPVVIGAGIAVVAATVYAFARSGSEDDE